MKHLLIMLIAICCLGCQSKTTKPEATTIKSETLSTEDYELHKAAQSKALLILFPGGGGDAKGTLKEFKIAEAAAQNQMSLLLINYARNIWVNTNDCKALVMQIENIIKTHQLPPQKVFIGGMSIGGNVTLALTQYLLQQNKLSVKGAFVVDPPLDLYALYESSVSDVARNDLSEERLAEPKFIINYFEDNFGTDSLLTNIQTVSPYTYKTQHIENISALKTIHLQLYTEPDKNWWKANRDTDFKNTNAFSIQQLHKTLKQQNWTQVQLIETKNKGFRSDGTRHPHSWSIVDVGALIDWISESKLN
ncbi:alpha/beta hydrolase fold domain-containing protein [Winogradskyella sp.]|jgi:pimeloyl-ACP methyl ester carboxylesterase|uniref:alpha/beta hydrolase fold domain-containing protein n=1 Tax=Winogradskyella sp. TaxID=1883156 RepID=UPI00260135E7|nr:alpha/beta hydrolase fold domain-containing protein [Winogradskyella sp.]MCT4630458.1 alpha/beta hydrolase fold domain-containing protein [Winogradskyella sp.]